DDDPVGFRVKRPGDRTLFRDVVGELRPARQEFIDLWVAELARVQRSTTVILVVRELERRAAQWRYAEHRRIAEPLILRRGRRHPGDRGELEGHDLHVD